jgi:hypothetical protein
MRNPFTLKFLSFVLLSLILASTTCDRGDRLWTLQYRVEVVSGKGEFTAKFLSPSGADVQVGDLSETWKSQVYNRVETGTRVRLLVEKSSGDQELRIEILRDGAVHESGDVGVGEMSSVIFDSL